MELKWKLDKIGKCRKLREEGVWLDVVLCYECVKEYDSLILCDIMWLCWCWLLWIVYGSDFMY